MKLPAVNKFYHVYGGADRYFFELGSLLERHGHTVVPFSMQDAANFESPYSKHFVSHVEMFEAASVREKLRAAGRILYSREARRSIKRLVSDKGFGFILGDDGSEYFFHNSACQGTRFDELREGQSVTFEKGQGPKGPRAESVRVS